MEAQAALRLPSKTFADVPVMIRDHTLHLLIAHPTPPSFDGPEDRNGKRNHDEIRLIAEYISSQKQEWLRDDDGQRGGLAQDEAFVIAGDLNADPLDTPAPEQTNPHAIAALIDHPRVTDPQPKSAGGRDTALRQKGRNQTHRGDPALDTSDYYDRTVGNLRADYVLPSSNLTVIDSGVFWPVPGEPGYRWVGRGYPKVSSDHRLVWVDIAWPGAR
ncbi:MAG: endonuclease/exonuclease/phosphatase family protein [Pseudomonadota bacterium]